MCVPMCDSSFLQLPCRVFDTCVLHDKASAHADNEFAASVFGVSPVNEVGNVRRIGCWLLCGCASGSRGVFWQVQVYSYRGTVYSVDSNYHVTIVEDKMYSIYTRSTTFIIHPVPREELVDCMMYEPPQWKLYADGYPVPMVQVENGLPVWSDKADWYDGMYQYSASIKTWVPRAANCESCGKGADCNVFFAKK